MSKLSIVTINYNDLEGLKKTVGSVLSQTSTEFEYIIIDGGSTDGSAEYIKDIAKKESKVNIKWISEKDKGIYNAQNKGISLSKGDYLQFLNSGDILVDSNVTEKMLSNLKEDDKIIYGNMLKQLPKGLFRDKGFEGRKPTFLDFYYGTLNHSPAYIQKSLFEKYGLYDETLKIVSDWKWYLQVIILFNNPIRYVPVDVTFFDMNGISNTNKTIEKDERKKVLNELIPEKILEDFDSDAFGMDFTRRMKRVPTGMILFKIMNRIYSWLDRKIYNNYIR